MYAPKLVAGKPVHNLKLAAARMQIAKRGPYWMSAVRALVPYMVEGLGTMAVTERGVLLMDAAFVETQPVDHLGTVLVHEALHIVFRHAKRGKAYGAQLNHELWNVACDLEINDGLAAGGWNMGKGIVPKMYGYPDGLVAEEYYRRLRQDGQKGPSEPAPMNGWDGSGAGRAVPGEPANPCDAAPQSPPAGGAKGEEGEQPTPPANASGEPLGHSDEAMEALANETARAMKQAGKLPGGFARWADERTAPPRERWQDKLKKECRTLARRVRGYGRVSYSRFDRKQAGLGYGPGLPILPGHHAVVPRVAVAIDTSGSMTEDVLGEALSEVKHIFEAAGAPVDFLACDAEVHVHERVRDYRQIKGKLLGGGGTDFRPVFRALDKAKNPSDRPEVLIFVTDGYGTAPAHKPEGMHVVWLLVEGGVAPAKWGEVIHLGADRVVQS